MLGEREINEWWEKNEKKIKNRLGEID